MIHGRSHKQVNGVLPLTVCVSIVAISFVFFANVLLLPLPRTLQGRSVAARTLENNTMESEALKGLRAEKESRTDEASRSITGNEFRPYSTPSSPDWPTEATWKAELGDLLSPQAELFNNMDLDYQDTCRSDEVGYSFFEEHRGMCLVFDDCRYQFCNRDGQKTNALPPYTVKVITPEDISIALAFANKYNIQVSVKLTGHNFAGQGYTKDSLNIWMIHLETHGNVYEDFQDSCGTRNLTAVGVGGGALNNDVFDTVQGNYHIVTGDTRSVGFAGWLLGAGLSHTSRRYGLGIDNILAYDIVLANGTEVVADACTNSDLFWALRGGGGGFGVVTRMFYKLLPVSKTVKIGFLVTGEISRPQLRAYMEYWLKVTSDADTRIAGGYFGLGNFEIYVMGDAELAYELFVNDFQSFLEESLANVEYKLTVREKPHWYSVLGGDNYMRERQNRNLNKYGHGPKASARIIPKQMVQDDPDGIIELFLDIGMNYDMGGYWLGGAVADVAADATATHPALRSALWAMTTTDRKASQKFREFFNNSVSGCSFNHHSPEEPEWRSALWGDENYARLLTVKKKYDPENRFNCWHCVGYQGLEFSVDDLPPTITTAT